MFPEDVLRNNSGKFRTVSLFKEKSNNPEDKPIFTLGRDKKDGYVSLRDLYIALCTEDPTEDTFVETVFGDYQGWKTLSSVGWIQPYLKEWREVCDTKRKTVAFKAIIKEVKEGKSPFAAAKYLIEEPWKGRKTSARTTRKHTTENAFEAVSSDIDRLKAEGLLN